MLALLLSRLRVLCLFVRLSPHRAPSPYEVVFLLSFLTPQSSRAQCPLSSSRRHCYGLRGPRRRCRRSRLLKSTLLVPESSSPRSLRCFPRSHRPRPGPRLPQSFEPCLASRIHRRVNKLGNSDILKKKRTRTTTARTRTRTTRTAQARRTGVAWRSTGTQF